MTSLIGYRNFSVVCTCHVHIIFVNLYFSTAWTIRKTGTLLADVCFEVQCLKSLSNLVFTHLLTVDESIYVTYFQQKDIHTK